MYVGHSLVDLSTYLSIYLPAFCLSSSVCLSIYPSICFSVCPCRIPSFRKLVPRHRAQTAAGKAQHGTSGLHRGLPPRRSPSKWAPDPQPWTPQVCTKRLQSSSFWVMTYFLLGDFYYTAPKGTTFEPVGKIMAFLGAIFCGFGLLFYILWGSRWASTWSSKQSSKEGSTSPKVGPIHIIYTPKWILWRACT